MARLSDFLERFRPTGVPGAAAPAGVPADYAETASDELDPVFAALAETRRECDAVDAEARRDAERIVERARREAAALVAEARLAADAERARAGARARAATAEECRRITATGDAEAEQVRRLAAERLDGLTDEAVALVLALRDAPPGGGP
jgi:F0F1-type ATP synthase membrane subunit b/b'